MIPHLNVRRLSAEKKYSGKLMFSFEGDQQLIEIPYVSFSSPVRTELAYEILEDDSVEVKASFSYHLQGLCSRCLKETEQKISFESVAYFIPEGGKGQDDDYFYRNGVIDLSEFLRDAVLFSMPAGLLCSEDCSAPDYKED